MSSSLPSAGSPPGSFADKLTIETPEQTALDFTIAGVGSRFLALAIDLLIQTAVGTALGIVAGFGMVGLRSVGSTAEIWAGAVLLLLLFLLYFGYYAFFEIMWRGQTPGKRQVGIRVIKDSGRPLTPSESIGRNLMRIVDWLPALYAVGIVSMLITKENKRLGDLVVGSLVVRESSSRQQVPNWQTSETASGPAQTPLGAGQLSVEESTLIDSYLSRRFELESYVRHRIASEILDRIRPKLRLPSEDSRSSEKILEALAYERRATGRYD